MKLLRSGLVVTGSAFIACMTAIPNLSAAKGGGGPPPPATYIPVIDTYNGRATAVEVSVTTPVASLNPIIGDTGYLGPTTAESSESFDVLSITLPQSTPVISLGADVIDGVTTSMGNTTTSFANIALASLGISGVLTVNADVLQASITATDSDGPTATCPQGSASGSVVGTVSLVRSSTITNLSITVAGTPVNIPVNPAPNTTISLGSLGSIILNEQDVGPDGLVQVNAVDIDLNVSVLNIGLVKANVVLAHAAADISAACGQASTSPPPSCVAHDFMTGGGYITLSSGAKGTFGFVGGYKPGGLQGHLNYIDHGNGTHIVGTSPTAYTATGATSRAITYPCSVGSNPDTCVLDAADNGEPGAGVDGFDLTSGQYSADGPTITQGNIQLHKSSCPSFGSGSSGGGKHGG